jgi:hypothetical protein
MSCLSNILRTNKEDGLNILCCPFDGEFEASLAVTCPKHKFFLLPQLALYQINPVTLIRTKNLQILHQTEQAPINLEFDAVMYGGPTQYEFASKTAHALHVPLVSVEHCWPNIALDTEQIQNIIKQQIVDFHMVPTQALVQVWGRDISKVIPYRVFSNPSTKQPFALMVGRLEQKETEIVSMLTQGSNFNIQTINLASTTATHDQLVDVVGQSLIYLNVIDNNRISPHLLSAMAAGSAIISIESNLCENLLIHEQNALVCKPNPQSVISSIAQLTDNEAMIKKLGSNAQKTIETLMPNNVVNDLWQQSFADIKQHIYVRH